MSSSRWKLFVYHSLGFLLLSSTIFHIYWVVNFIRTICINVNENFLFLLLYPAFPVSYVNAIWERKIFEFIEGNWIYWINFCNKVFYWTILPISLRWWIAYKKKFFVSSPSNWNSFPRFCFISSFHYKYLLDSFY